MVEWQTRQSQKLLGGNPRVGSNPTSGTIPLPLWPRVRYNAGKRMHIFNVVLQSVLVLLGIGFVGLWITRRRILPENVISVLSTLVIDIALPATVFASIIINFKPSDFPPYGLRET